MTTVTRTKQKATTGSATAKKKKAKKDDDEIRAEEEEQVVAEMEKTARRAERMAKKETKADKDKKIRWRKTGRGSFMLANGRRIKPNQLFTARPDEIPRAFRDNVVPLDPLPDEPSEPAVSSVTEFQVISRGEDNDEGEAMYDVVQSASGKRMNEIALTFFDATEMVKVLTDG